MEWPEEPESVPGHRLGEKCLHRGRLQGEWHRPASVSWNRRLSASRGSGSCKSEKPLSMGVELGKTWANFILYSEIVKKKNLHTINYHIFECSLFSPLFFNDGSLAGKDQMNTNHWSSKDQVKRLVKFHGQGLSKQEELVGVGIKVGWCFQNSVLF